jgi:hypothetical protein
MVELGIDACGILGRAAVALRGGHWQTAEEQLAAPDPTALSALKCSSQALRP